MIKDRKVESVKKDRVGSYPAIGVVIMYLNYKL